MNAPFDELPSPYIVTRLAEHVGAAGKWQDLAERPYLLDTLDPDSVAAAALRTAYGRSALPASIAASLSARHLLKRLRPPDRLMTRWIAMACGWSAPDAEPRAWANIGYREPAHIVLTGHRGTVLSVAALRTDDGIAVASAGRDATVRIWDPTTGRPARHQLDTGGTVVSVVVGLRTSGGRLLAGVSEGGAIWVWNWQTGVQTAAIPASKASGRGLLAALPQQGGVDLLCAGTVRGDLGLWEVGVDGSLVQVALLTPPSPVRMITVMPQGDDRTALVTAGYDGVILLWDIPAATAKGFRMNPSGRIEYPSGGIEAVAGVVGPDGRHLLLVAEDGQGLDLIAVGDDLSFDRELATSRLPRDGLACVATMNGQEIIVAGDRSGLLNLWRHVGGEWRTMTAMAGHAGAITTMASLSFADGRSMVVTGGQDATVRLWHPDAEPEDRPSADGLVTVCINLRLGPDEILVTGSNRGVVQTWDARSGLARPGFRFEDRGAIYAAATVDVGGETVVVTAGTERLVRVWNTRSGDSVVDPLRQHEDTIHAVAVIRDFRGLALIASAGADRTIRFWDPRTGRAMGHPLVGHRASINHLAVVAPAHSPELLVSAGNESVVWLWRPAGPAEYIGSELHLESEAKAIGVSGELILAVCAGGEIHAFDAGRGESAGLIGTVGDGEPLALAVVRLAEDTLIVVGTESGEVQLWSLRGRRCLRTTLLPLGLRPLALVVMGDWLVIQTQRGFLGCKIDPRVLASYQPFGFRSQDGRNVSA